MMMCRVRCPAPPAQPAQPTQLHASQTLLRLLSSACRHYHLSTLGSRSCSTTHQFKHLTFTYLLYPCPLSRFTFSPHTTRLKAHRPWLFAICILALALGHFQRELCKLTPDPSYVHSCSYPIANLFHGHSRLTSTSASQSSISTLRRR